MLAERPLLMVAVHPDEAVLDAEAVHGAQRDGHRVLTLCERIGHAFEHVLHRKVEVVQALRVVQLRPEKGVHLPLVGEGEVDHRVDDPATHLIFAWKCHDCPLICCDVWRTFGPEPEGLPGQGSESGADT